MAEDEKTRPEETAAEAEMRFTEAGSLDMENRDPKNLNSHIAYSFHDVIGEPETAHSAPAVWIRAYRCFNGSANCCYIFLTYLCAIPAACCWGCNLACLAFEHIWCLTPSIKYCKINLYPLMRLYSFAIQCLCVPFFEAVALIFSKVGIHKVDQPPQYKSRHDEFEAMMTQI